MADNPVRSTSSVPSLSGFPGRSSEKPAASPHKRDAEAASAGAEDRVQLALGATIALPLLRERVLARTRSGLDLGPVAVPCFAEMLEGEPVPAFLGRLLSAQNQLAACRAAVWSGERIRAVLAEALAAGAEETIDLLAADGHGPGGAIAIVTEVLEQFGRRRAVAAASI